MACSPRVACPDRGAARPRRPSARRARPVPPGARPRHARPRPRPPCPARCAVPARSPSPSQARQPSPGPGAALPSLPARRRARLAWHTATPPQHAPLPQPRRPAQLQRARPVPVRWPRPARPAWRSGPGRPAPTHGGLPRLARPSTRAARASAAAQPPVVASRPARRGWPPARPCCSHGPAQSGVARLAPGEAPLPCSRHAARRVRGSAPTCARLVRGASARPCARGVLARFAVLSEGRAPHHARGVPVYPCPV
jgi:hypothetical protein